MTCSPGQPVFVFQGLKAETAVATFSNRCIAEKWISQHELTGVLTQFTVDNPPYDDWLREQRDKATNKVRDPEKYTNCEHWHYFLGCGYENPGFDQAQETWLARNADQGSEQ